MEETIARLRASNLDVPVPLELPDEDTLVEVEEALLLSLPYAYRQFLLQVSDVICGSIEPATVADPNSHSYLPELAAQAWSLGVSRELIPICEASDGYYAISVEGKVSYWTRDGEQQSAEWESIWDWVEEVWLDS